MAGASSNRKEANVPMIPIEIISDEEMAFIEDALASASVCSPLINSVAVPEIHSPPSASRSYRNAKSVQSVSVQVKRKLFISTELPDIEDYGNLVNNQRDKKKKKKKRNRRAESFLHRFRSKRGLSVTDITSTEWCKKKMEFSLLSEEQKKNNKLANRPDMDSSSVSAECCGCSCCQKQMDLALVFGGGKRNNKEAMKAGIARHVQLEQEILKRVELDVKSCEDKMALKLVNFINGVNQLLFEGLTRELPIVSFALAEGIWMVGVIDEIRMPMTENDHSPILIETKTRSQDTLPSEPQQRNGRIQLMCYKYLWDNLVADYDFPSELFFDYFGLNPKQILCEDLRMATSESGFSSLTLDDVVRCYENTCKMLAPACDQLVLKYESQKDHSLIGEDRFEYDDGWLKNQMRSCIEFWVGEKRDATFAAEKEAWKCRYCEFCSKCPAYADYRKHSGIFK